MLRDQIEEQVINQVGLFRPSGHKRNLHNKKNKSKIGATRSHTLQKELQQGNVATQILPMQRNQQHKKAKVEFRNLMLLTRFEPLRGLEESKPPKGRRVLSPKQKGKRNITQRLRARVHKFFHKQLKMGDMQINAMPLWAHPQRGDPSLPSYTKNSLGYTPYMGNGKIFGSIHDTQAMVMFVGAKKDVLVNTPSSSRSWL